MTKEISHIIWLFIIMVILVIALMVAITNQYDGYKEFCEERNMSFEGGYGEPICYKIISGKLSGFNIGKINGEIYEK